MQTAPIPALAPAQEVAVLARALYREGYDDHHTGHITVRQAPHRFFALPAQYGWDEVQASNVVVMDGDGIVIDGQLGVPPAIQLHVELHRARDVNVAIHQHPRYASVWSAMGRIPDAYDQGASLVDSDDIALFPDYVGDVISVENARKNVEALGDKSVALLGHHGVLVVGDNVRQAFSRAVQLEWRCKQAWHVEALGAGVAMPRNRQRELADAHRRGGDVLRGLWEWAVRRELRIDASVLD